MTYICMAVWLAHFTCHTTVGAVSMPCGPETGCPTTPGISLASAAVMPCVVVSWCRASHRSSEELCL